MTRFAVLALVCLAGCGRGPKPLDLPAPSAKTPATLDDLLASAAKTDEADRDENARAIAAIADRPADAAVTVPALRKLEATQQKTGKVACIAALCVLEPALYPDHLERLYHAHARLGFSDWTRALQPLVRRAILPGLSSDDPKWHARAYFLVTFDQVDRHEYLDEVLAAAVIPVARDPARPAHATALGVLKKSPQVVPAYWLAELAATKDPAKRREIAALFARKFPAKHIPLLRPLLTDRDEDVRTDFAIGLFTSGDYEKAVPVLVVRDWPPAKFGGKNRYEQILEWLQTFTKPEERSRMLPEAKKALSSVSSTARLNALAMVAALDVKDITIYAPLLTDTDKQVREAALMRVPKCPPDATRADAVLAVAEADFRRDKDGPYNPPFELVLQWVGASGVRTQAGFDQLVKLTKCGDPHWEFWGFITLPVSGPLAEKSIPSLADALKRDWRKVSSTQWGNPFLRTREGVLLARVGKAGPLAAPLVPEVIRYLQERIDQDVPSRATVALGQIGPAAKGAVPVLVKRFDYWAEAELKNPRRGKDKPEPEWEDAVAQALGRIGPDARDALPTLKAYAEKRPKNKYVADAIQKIEAPPR